MVNVNSAHDAHLSARYDAARAYVKKAPNRDRITVFMEGEEWGRKYRERHQPVSAEAGPRKITVGDLSAAMIGHATIRVEHEGATVQGTLADLKIDAEIGARLKRMDDTTARIVYDITVSLTIGQVEFHDLRISHPVEVLS